MSSSLKIVTASKPSEPDLAREKADDRVLLIASRDFAEEIRGTSWWHLWSTLSALIVCGIVAGCASPLWLRGLASVISGLILVRMFIIYHDFQHHSMLQNSFIARRILHLYGHLMLTPPSVWRRSHNHHHKNNSKLFGASIGSFPIMTTANYQLASWSEKLEYRIARNPMVIVLGYFTVFLFGMCLRPMLMDPRRHLDAWIALAIHFGTIVGVWFFAGTLSMLFVCVIPTWIATSSGAYLFYVQHNFPGAKIRRSEHWTYTGAALHSSSMLEMGPVMHWFTGNIGYHHVHHLNAKIPFYRLPEAMRGLAALQTPTTVSLSLSDMFACLRLKLWDANREHFVTFGQANADYVQALGPSRLPKSAKLALQDCA